MKAPAPIVPIRYPGPGSAIGLTVSAVFIMVLVILFFGEDADLGAVGLGQVLGFGAVALLAHERIAEPQAERMGLRGVAPAFLPTLLLLLPTVILTSELDNILRDMIPPPPLDPELESMLSLADANLLATLQRVIVIVGLAPVMEEWLFRGVIQQGLISNMGRIKGLVLTAFLFALVQLFPGGASTSVLAYFPIAFINGLAFGVVRLASGSLLAAMLVHAGFNAISLAAGYGVERFPIQGFNVPDSHTEITLLLPCVVMVGYAISQLRRELQTVEDEIPLPESGEGNEDFDV
jgi:membrane protease YdiL (CAAX protease family)